MPGRWWGEEEERTGIGQSMLTLPHLRPQFRSVLTGKSRLGCNPGLTLVRLGSPWIAHSAKKKKRGRERELVAEKEEEGSGAWSLGKGGAVRAVGTPGLVAPTEPCAAAPTLPDEGIIQKPSVVLALAES